MRKIIVLFCLAVSLTVTGQTDDTAGQAARRQQRRDSIKSMQALRRDSLLEVLKAPDQQRISEDMRRSTEYFVQLQKENRAKQKRAAIQRIIFGGAMLVVLVIGLMRRRKKTR
jgi:hypothetical protein